METVFQIIKAHVINPNKTKKISVRIIQGGGFCHEAVQSATRQKKEKSVTEVTHITEVFVVYYINKPDSVSSWFSKFMKQHPEIPFITLHSLRHTNATLQLAAGVPITTISKRLGHSNTATTGRVYAHAIQSSCIKKA